MELSGGKPGPERQALHAPPHVWILVSSLYLCGIGVHMEARKLEWTRLGDALPEWEH